MSVRSPCSGCLTPDIFVSARKRKLNTLKPSYFVSGVVGLFVGFPRHKRVIDGYARCLMCKVDLSIAGRGLQNLWGHWKGVEHTRLEQKYRIMTQRPLLDKPCRPVSAEEDRRIRLERMSEPPVYLESPIGLSLDERVALEQEEEIAAARPNLSAESTAYLWLCFFLNCFSTVTNFRGVMQLMDGWTTAMSGELSFVGRSLTYAKCQVCIVVFMLFAC